AAGDPKPPAPTMRTLACPIFCWPLPPTSGRRMCRLYRVTCSSESAIKGIGGLNVKVFLDADVALARVAEHRDHVLTGPELRRDLLGGGDIGPGRDADQEPFLLRQQLGHLVCLVVRYGEHAIQDRAIQDLGDEPRADSLDPARARVP